MVDSVDTTIDFDANDEGDDTIEMAEDQIGCRDYLESLNPLNDSVVLDIDNVTIGRGSDCTKATTFSDRRLSSRHCRIFMEEGAEEFKIEDISANGTFVNGHRLSRGAPKVLFDGDVLTLLVSSLSKKKVIGDQFVAYRYVKGSRTSSEGSSFAELRQVEQRRRREEKSPIVAPDLQNIDENVNNSNTNSQATDQDDDPWADEDDEDDEEATSEHEDVTKKERITGKRSHDKIESPPSSDSPTATANATQKNPNAELQQREREQAVVSEPTKRVKEIDPSDITCLVCQDILYKCVSLVPCLHNFCAGCYSEWKERNTDCPVCRSQVDSVRRNHSLMSLAESYLEAHPDLKRSQEELDRLDSVNKITSESLTIRRPGGGGGGHNYDYSDYSSSEEEPEHCRECTTPRPSDGFTCTALTVDARRHLNCDACREPFPFRAEHQRETRCCICRASFCDAYWGCNSPNGRRALVPWEDTILTEFPPSLFGGNKFETQILKEYCTAENISMDNLTDICKDGLADGTFKFESAFGQATVLQNDDHLCNHCSRNVYSKLLYQYRLSINTNELPAVVDGQNVDRNNCWYGYACRTQFNKEDHAKKLNHVCEPSRPGVPRFFVRQT